MKNWKAVLAGVLVLCLLVCMPMAVLAEEAGDSGEETEEPLPDSYYLPIETNQIKDWPKGPEIEAASAAVMDMDSGVFLYSKNAQAKQYPASITKIMTTLLLVENCDLEDEITFSEIVYDIEEGSSHAGAQPGEKMKLRDVAYCIMLESANDMSNAVAEYIGGSLSGFAELMNARAAELGCVNTHFANPHGLYRDDHYTCAYDMALIARAAYENPAFREIVTTREYRIPETNLTEEERYPYNHHKMMHKESEYYRDYCTGGKTGFTSECLNTLVTYGEKDGKRLVSVILRVNGAGKSYNETAAILEYGFVNFSTVNYKRNNSLQTFYDIMGLNYPGAASYAQSEVWKRSPISDYSAVYTVPNNVSADRLKYETVQRDGNRTVVSCLYEGEAVGTAGGVFYPVYVPVQLPFEGKPEEAAQEAAPEPGADGKIQMEGLDDVLVQTTAIFHSGYDAFESYARGHMMTVLIAGAILLIVVIVFIVILIFRCTSDVRIRRRRKQEEEERRRREEEIDRMTTAEIEAELRAVMEQERIRKEREAHAQAVRAAKETEYK